MLLKIDFIFFMQNYYFISFDFRVKYDQSNKVSKKCY